MIPVWYPDSVTADLSRGIHYTLLWGLEGVVLRYVGGPGQRVPFVNEEKLKRRLQEADLPIIAVDPGLFEGSSANKVTWLNELMVLEDIASFCHRIGTQAIVLSALAGGGEYKVDEAVGALQKAGDVASRHGVTLLVANDANSNCATASNLAQLLALVSHPNVLAFWRPCEALKRGEAEDAGLASLNSTGIQIGMVEATNVQIKNGEWRNTRLADGDIDWMALAHLLKNGGYRGPIALSVTEKPAAKVGLSDATTLIQAMR